jgi:two-component system, NarL family, sensor kinase
MCLDGLLDPASSSEWKDSAASDCREALDRAVQQVRSVSHLLHPPLLDEIGLHCALQQYLEGFTKRSAIQAVLDMPNGGFPRLKPELETAVFRIVQEALTNVLRHSGASQARVTVAMRDSRMTVTVRDDGKGIPDHIIEFRGGSLGIGISGMRQRVKELGGELRLQNANPGTLVEVTIPSVQVGASRG